MENRLISQEKSNSFENDFQTDQCFYFPLSFNIKKRVTLFSYYFFGKENLCALKLFTDRSATDNDLFDFRFGKRTETNSNFAPIDYDGQVRFNNFI